MPCFATAKKPEILVLQVSEQLLVVGHLSFQLLASLPQHVGLLAAVWTALDVVEVDMLKADGRKERSSSLSCVLLGCGKQPAEQTIFRIDCLEGSYSV